MIQISAHFRRWLAVWAGVAALLSSASADAGGAYTVSVKPNVALGNMTSGSTGDTLFRIDPASGSVTLISGTGNRSSNAPARAVVTISCAAFQATDCNKDVIVKLGPVGSTIGRGRSLTNIQFAMGTAVLTGSSGPLTFTIGPIGPNSSQTVYVGADFGIGGDDSGLATGLAESDFFAWAAETPTQPTTGSIGRIQAQVFRGLAITKTSDLVFGSVSRPPAGSGSVTIDPATGARTTAGSVVGFALPAPSRAVFNVTGEGGQAFSISVPATISMSGPQSMLVTTTNSASASPVLSGAIGAQGAYAFGVGGAAPINASTQIGAYTGSFTVTVSYN